MKKITLIIILILLCPELNAQEEMFVLHPTYTKQVINDQNFEPIAYEVNIRNLTKVYIENRKTKKIDKKDSFVLGKEISYEELQGQFKKIGTYAIIKQDYKTFLKNEIIKNETVIEKSISSKYIAMNNYTDIILNTSTKKYYMVTYNFLKKFNFGSVKSVSQNNSGTRLQSSMSLTKENSLKYAIEKYKSMILRCKELNTRLIIYGRLAKKGSMSKKQIFSWKRDLVEAKLLNIRIDEFKSRYKREEYKFQDYVNQEMLDNYEDFANTLSSVQEKEN